MIPRFDVFRKQNDHFIKWVGTAENLEDLEKLIRAESGSAPQHDYVIYRSAYGVTEALVKPSGEKALQIAAPGRDRV
jgi:hypothetical protein